MQVPEPETAEVKGNLKHFTNCWGLGRMKAYSYFSGLKTTFFSSKFLPGSLFLLEFSKPEMLFSSLLPANSTSGKQ